MCEPMEATATAASRMGSRSPASEAQRGKKGQLRQQHQPPALEDEVQRPARLLWLGGAGPGYASKKVIATPVAIAP